jgi:hypothetical protein
VITLPIHLIPYRWRILNTEAATAWVVMFFMLLFAMWTLAHHAATFLGIPWRTLSLGSAVACVPLALLAAWGAQHFSLAYAEQVAHTPSPTGLQGKVPVIWFVAITALLLVAPTFGLRFGVALIGFALMWWLTRQDRTFPQSGAAPSPAVPVPTHAIRSASWLLVVLALGAVAVTLVSHRPDLDDSSFIQIAAQTLRFPDRAPLTFDASLGTISEPFRFAPYRLASYETLVAFLVEWTRLDLLTVYYLLLPGLTAALTVGVAFLFARWFLPCGVAIVGVGIFMLISLAWGDTHRTYGNFVFVRLFQGKGLLIALTTPMTLIAGLMLLRRPSAWNWTFLALAQVAAIGVSSSGLVCSFVATALILAAAMRHDMRVFIVLAAIIVTTLVYPAVLGAWVKFIGGRGASLNELGTLLPINASLGLGGREAIALAVLPLGIGAMGLGVQRREYTLLAGATLVLVFNPWLSGLLSGLSARNVSWRLAWATPLPLLLAVALAATVSPILSPRPETRIVLSLGAVTGLVALMFFLGAARWTLAPSNNVTWHWPSPKVPAEFASAREISAELKSFASQGAVLANREIGAWLPFLAPEVRLVMPGHTYPIMLKTVLPATEFNGRIQLFDAINGEALDAAKAVELMRQFNVAVLLVRQDSDGERYIIETLLRNSNVSLRDTNSIDGYRLFFVDVRSTSRSE